MIGTIAIATIAIAKAWPFEVHFSNGPIWDYEKGILRILSYKADQINNPSETL